MCRVSCVYGSGVGCEGHAFGRTKARSCKNVAVEKKERARPFLLLMMANTALRKYQPKMYNATRSDFPVSEEEEEEAESSAPESSAPSEDPTKSSGPSAAATAEEATTMTSPRTDEDAPRRRFIPFVLDCSSATPLSTPRCSPPRRLSAASGRRRASTTSLRGDDDDGEAREVPRTA